MKRHAKALAFTATTALLAAAAESAGPAHAFDIAPGSIVYSQLVPGSPGGLVVSNPDGSGSHALHPSGNGLSAASQIYQPAVSPDGSRVAFADFATHAIWVAGIDGSQPVRISGPAGSAVDSEPTWAPSGREVYFTRRAAEAQIFVAWADGRGDRSLFSSTGTNDTQPNISANGDLAFVRSTAGGSAVFIWKFAGTPTQLALGTFPAWSPDGTRLAYGRGGSIFVKPTDGGPESLIGTSGIQAAHPAWASDGARLTFEGHLPGHNQQIWVVDTRSLEVSPVGAEPGAGVADSAPAWQTVRKSGVDRVGGADRVDTAVAAARLGYDTPGPGGTGKNGGRVAQAVVLSRSDTFADALAGSALAGHLGGPLLLTGTGSLDDRTAAEIRRCLPPGGTVYLLGAAGALSATVEAQVKALGHPISRLAGPDRYATATAIAGAVAPAPDRILVATGNNFPDALAAGAAAASTGNTVVLLSDDRVLPGSTAAYLAAHVGPATQLVGIGDQGVAALRTKFPAGRVQAAAGPDRFATAAAVAQTFFTAGNAPRTVGLATGYNWPDALAGGALVGANGGPLLLADTSAIPGPEADYVRTEAAAINEVVVNGGAGVVPANAAASLANLAGVFGQWNYFDSRNAPALP
jgi:putative cell wall-binding protein